MRKITLRGVKVAKWRTTGLNNKPCPPTLEEEEFVAVGTQYVDPKELLDLIRKKRVASDWDTGDRQHSSMIQVENGNDAHGCLRYRWELRIYHHEYYTGWDVITYHEEEYEIPEGKTWFIYADINGYADGTDVTRYYSTFEKACEMYHADPEDLEDDPFDWQRYNGYLSLGYIGLDGEDNTLLMSRYTIKEDEDDEE
tara:strand:- start:779 stop:1369 length:591 start_codon:yes stop_codon:yes gene_type:complete